MPENNTPTKPKQPVWLVYVSLFVAGVILLGDAFSWSFLYSWTARLGVALVFSAVALLIGNGRSVGYIASGLVCLAALATFVY